MPLHAQKTLVFGTFDRFDFAVGSASGDAKSWPGVGHRLVVETIDGDVRAEESAQSAVGLNRHAMGGFVARCRLRMFDEQRCIRGTLHGGVLIDATAQGRHHHLHTATDAEHRDLTVGRETHEQQLLTIAHRVDAAELRNGLFAHPERIEVGTAREEESVDAVEKRFEGCEVGRRRKDERRPPGREHRLVIAGCQFATFLPEIARDGNQRPLRGKTLRVLRIERC